MYNGRECPELHVCIASGPVTDRAADLHSDSLAERIARGALAVASERRDRQPHRVEGHPRPHELLVFKSDLDPSAYPTDAAGDIKEKGAGVNLVSDGDNIDPAGSQTRSIDLAPGMYLFVCNIPGHFKQGMFTVVTVAP